MIDLDFLVATVLTVYGIETWMLLTSSQDLKMLQQYLPFTVLKRDMSMPECMSRYSFVATVLTVYGIETLHQYMCESYSQVATVLTVYGIETHGLPPHQK